MAHTYEDGWVVSNGDQFYVAFFAVEQDAEDYATVMSTDFGGGSRPAFVIAAKKVTEVPD